jgi:AcrR family transcriptional regulator
MVSQPVAARVRKAPLSRDQIAARALAYLDRHGLDALSMRRLAQDLGVGTMTLYGYFRDKGELLDAVVDAAATEHPVRPRGRMRWKPYLRALMLDMHEGLLRHPALIGIRLGSAIATPSAFRITEAGLQALHDAGLTDREAARAFRALFIHTFGSAAFQTPDSDEADARRGAATLAALPRDQFPVLTARGAQVFDDWGGESQFERELDLLLDGIGARVATKGDT